jgi:Clp amino terminal domain, pathogenicity island component
VFQQFTERARQVVVLAHDEARDLKHNYIGTEHLLLGLLREEDGLGARVLESLDIGLEDARAEVARTVGVGDEVRTGQIPFTPRAKRVLELALREALSLGHNYIGTEHILLGLTREADGVAMQILLELDAGAEQIRNEIISLLSGTPSPAVQPVELHPDLRAEVERVRAEKQAALEAQEFEQAAAWRVRERNLVRLGQEGDHDAFWEEARRPLSESRLPPARIPPRRSSVKLSVASPPASRAWTVASLAGGTMFGVALGLGILVGRLVWG